MKGAMRVLVFLIPLLVALGCSDSGDRSAHEEWRFSDIQAAVDAVVETKVQPILDMASAVAPGGFAAQDELLVRHALSFLITDLAQDLVYGAGMDPDTAAETAHTLLLSLAAAIVDSYQVETGEVLPLPNSTALFPDWNALQADMEAKLAERGLSWDEVANETRATVEREASRLAVVAGELLGEDVDLGDPDITRIMGYVETALIRQAATIAANSGASPGRAADLALNVLYDLPNFPAPLVFFLPRYQALNRDAKLKTLEGALAAGVSLVTLEYSRALLDGAKPCQWSWEEEDRPMGDFVISISARVDRTEGEKAASVTLTHYQGVPIEEGAFGGLEDHYSKSFTLDICSE